MSRRNSTAAFAAVLAAWLVAGINPPVRAEKADREKPINITADRVSEDNRKQEAVFDGNVLLTQGTLRVEANRIVVRQDKDGFDYATATGTPARFRQKRDGLDEYVNGHAQRIEYDGKQEIVQLFDKAQLTRGQDELASNYIRYDSRTEVFQAFDPGQKQTASGAEGGRVKAVIQPKPKTQTPPEQNPAVPLKPADSVKPQ